MYRFVFWLLILTVLTNLVFCDTQSGYIDINKQLGDLEYVNDFSNTICYTQIFGREFKNVPKITTALAEFKTDSSMSYHLFIKVRKIELSQTEAKFMILARKEVSLWTKVVFTYLATDHEDISVSISNLQTSDLSGCGKILQQIFEITSPNITPKSNIVAYINGFDVTSKQITSGEAVFQISVQVIEKKENSFSVSVSRISPIQIYSISIGYVSVNRQQDIQVSYNMEFLSKMGNESPYIFAKPHQINLKNSNVFLGFERFMFKSKQDKVIKSLAVTINQEYFVMGTLQSKYLQYARISYFVIKESMKCQITQIMSYNEDNKQIQCKKCPADSNRVPNKESNECVCMDGFHQIDNYCYKTPQKAIWNKVQSTFVCSKGFTMVHKSKSRQYKCQVPPKNKMFDSTQQKWVCINPFYEVDEECIQIPVGGKFDPKTKTIICDGERKYIEGKCLEYGENQQYSEADKKFVCKSQYFRIKKACVKPHQNSHYNQKSQQFVCNDGFYSSNPGKCDKVPKNMRFDHKSKKLVCEETFYQIKDIGCQSMPNDMQYDQGNKNFNCRKGLYMYKQKCQKPKQNEQWSQQIKQFICTEGTFRIQGRCQKPYLNTHYSTITLKFECNENYYDIKGECKAPPNNMKYSQDLKDFVCSRGFQQVNDFCLPIPEHMQWSTQRKRFVCLQQYYQMESGRCQRPKKNQVYQKKSKKFVCSENFYKMKGACKSLPQNAVYMSEQQDFKCNKGRFRQDNKCSSCGINCESCLSLNKCQVCAQGFKVSQQGICLEECGDGIRFQQKCDDNNNQDGDGCSNTCQVEPGYVCEGGSPSSSDKCHKLEEQLKSTESLVNIPAGPVDMKMVGMSHLYGKIILNVKMNYLPLSILSSPDDLTKIFRVLTNSKISLKVSTMYIDTTEYTFVVLYDFNKVQPIPEYLTRIQISPQIKQKYYSGVEVNPLFIRINPAFMARKDFGSDNII